MFECLFWYLGWCWCFLFVSLFDYVCYLKCLFGGIVFLICMDWFDFWYSLLFKLLLFLLKLICELYLFVIRFISWLAVLTFIWFWYCCLLFRFWSIYCGALCLGCLIVWLWDSCLMRSCWFRGLVGLDLLSLGLV